MTINDIQAEMRADGSHWWDPDTMRCFGTRVVGPVFRGAGGIYFATSDKQWDGSRAYTVRQYDADTKDITTLGELGDYSTRRKAIARAKYAAGENCTADGSALRPVTVREQFIDDCRRHGNPQARIDDCDRLRSLAKRHQRYMVDYCNGRDLFDEDGEPVPPLNRCRQQIKALAKDIGAKSVILGGDPRGCTCKLVWNDGETNDFGKEGWCVPTE